MKMIKDSGIKVNKNFRLILGSNEENGSTDMEYYTSKESFPPMLFTPDGEFPIISIEKGMIRYDMSCCSDDKNIVSIKGGSVYNAVPETAQAIVAGISEDDIEVNSAEIHLEDKGSTDLGNSTAVQLGSELKTTAASYLDISADITVHLGRGIGLAGNGGIPYRRSVRQSFTVERRWEVA